MWTKFGAFILLVGISSSSGADTTFGAINYYSDAKCSTTPYFIQFYADTACEAVPCTTGTVSITGSKTCDVKTTDVEKYVADAFGSTSAFLYYRTYDDDACTQESAAYAVRQYNNGTCIKLGGESQRFSVRADGTVEERHYTTLDCTGDSFTREWTSKDVINHACASRSKLYATQYTAPSTTSAAASNSRQSGASVIALSFAVVATLAAAVSSSTIML